MQRVERVCVCAAVSVGVSCVSLSSQSVSVWALAVVAAMLTSASVLTMPQLAMVSSVSLSVYVEYSLKMLFVQCRSELSVQRVSSAHPVE